MKLEGSLVFPVKGDLVLLGRKTRGIGAGFWNGFGGKREEGESVEQGALRELEEEVGIRGHAEDLIDAGVVDFYNQRAGSEDIFSVRVYVLKQWQGEPRESEEMKSLTWFSVKDLPLHEMQASDSRWMPIIFEGCVIRAEARYIPKENQLIGDVKVERIGRWKPI